LLEGGWTGRNAAEVLPGVVVSMALVGVISAFRPAMRALRIQPTEALRSE
jgi:ABC-type antimicrobial peptide transport system permease subunit